jgi:hypothetical protein
MIVFIFRFKSSEHVIDRPLLFVLAQWLHLLVVGMLWLVVGLAVMPWFSHICLNSRLNSPLLPLSKTINWGQVTSNVPTRCYETSLRWMLLTYLWLWQFQTNQCCISGKKSWMDIADLFVASTISNQPVFHFWIYHCECKQRVCFCWCPYCKWTHQIYTNHDPGIVCQIQLYWVGAFHISYVWDLSLSFDIIDKWNINNHCSTSCVRPGHFMVFLIVCFFCSILYRMKYIFMLPGQHSLLLSQWLRDVYLFCYLCSKEYHTLQYVVLSNEVGLIPFLLILVPWLLLVLWRSKQYALGSFIWYYWFCCFLILREVLTLLPLESSGYQCKDWIKHPLQ